MVSLIDKLDANIVTGPGCWLWPTKRADGYAMASFEGRHHYVHRLTYELLVGPIPEGMTLDHLCRVRNCVNPAHLEPVSHRENVLRGFGPTAVNATKTHCSEGHPLEGDNLRLRQRPWGIERQCRECKRTRHRERKRRLSKGVVGAGYGSAQGVETE